MKRPRPEAEEKIVHKAPKTEKYTVQTYMQQLRCATDVHAKEVTRITAAIKEVLCDLATEGHGSEYSRRNVIEDILCNMLEIIEIPPSPLVQYDVPAVLEACGLPTVDSTSEKAGDDEEEEEERSSIASFLEVDLCEPLDKETFNTRTNLILSTLESIRSALVINANLEKENATLKMSLEPSEAPSEAPIPIQFPRQDAFEEFVSPPAPEVELQGVQCTEENGEILQSIATPRDQITPSGL